MWLILTDVYRNRRRRSGTVAGWQLLHAQPTPHPSWGPARPTAEPGTARRALAFARRKQHKIRVQPPDYHRTRPQTPHRSRRCCAVPWGSPPSMHPSSHNSSLHRVFTANCAENTVWSKKFYHLKLKATKLSELTIIILLWGLGFFCLLRKLLSLTNSVFHCLTSSNFLLKSREQAAWGRYIFPRSQNFYQ